MRHYVALIVIIAIFLLLVSFCGCQPASIAPSAEVSPKIVARDIGEIKQDIKQIQTTVANYGLDAERAKLETQQMRKTERWQMAGLFVILGGGVLFVFMPSPVGSGKSTIGMLIGLGIAVGGPLIVLLIPW